MNRDIVTKLPGIVKFPVADPVDGGHAPRMARGRMIKCVPGERKAFDEVIPMEKNNNCATEFHLHEVQGSVKIVGNGCEAHNHRFATVSCEPIDLGKGDHAHMITFRTDTYEGHYHEFTGRSSGADRVGDGHVHYLEGVTTAQDGHRHNFKVITHIEDPIED